MRQFVSIRHSGSLADIPTAWVFLGVLVPSAAIAIWPRSDAPVGENGILATVQSLLWIGSASICLFTAAVVHAARARRSEARFLLAAGLVTLWLGLDHVFALHMDVLSWSGVPGVGAGVIYAAIGGLYLLASWRQILANRPVLLLAAVLFLGGSLGASPLQGSLPPEALTFLAVAFWAGFHVAAAGRAVEELASGRITAVALSSARLIRSAA